MPLEFLVSSTVNAFVYGGHDILNTKWHADHPYMFGLCRDMLFCSLSSSSRSDDWIPFVFRIERQFYCNLLLLFDYPGIRFPHTNLLQATLVLTYYVYDRIVCVGLD